MKQSKTINRKRNNVMAERELKVTGMHCKSCELLLEREIGEVEGVEKVRANSTQGVIKVKGSDFDMARVEKAITAAGYSLGEEQTGLFTKDSSIYLDFVLSFLIVMILYVVFELFNLARFIPSVNSTSYALPVVLLLGLTAGFSTCMALVGGLVLGISARYREKHPENTGLASFQPHIYFNLGRIIGFGVLGGILGSLGSLFRISPTIDGLIIIAVSLVMVVVGVQLTEVSPVVNNYKVTLPKWLSRIIPVDRAGSSAYSHLKTFLAGTATFFLPCGFTQAMQLVAVTSGDFVTGALVMSVFAIGTTPGLLLIGTITSFANGVWGRKLFRFLGVLVVILALFNVSNAMNLIGVKLPSINFSSTSKTVAPAESKIENGTQTVTMTVNDYGYQPNKFVVKKGIPVKWVITVDNQGSCANYIIMQQMNVQKLLRSGENTIEFTPTDVGQLKFSCAMGMYNGEFEVKE